MKFRTDQWIFARECVPPGLPRARPGTSRNYCASMSAAAFAGPPSPWLGCQRRLRPRATALPPGARARTVVSAAAQAPSFDVDAFFRRLQSAQKSICSELELLDGGGATFCSDSWSRKADGSHGLTRVLQGGQVFEKAGVNTSLVQGVLSSERAAAMRSRGRVCDAGAPYRAAALSFVLHCHSPFMPTLRGDVRVFRLANGEFWGGGGCDLTPCYFDDDTVTLAGDWHRHWKRVCDASDATYYERFKRNCDEYFYLPMRAQWRGVGGLFWDDLKLPEEELCTLMYRVLDEFIPSYQPIVAACRDRPYSPGQKRFQRLRRTVYLEFNLTQDRGVRFGLGKDPSRTDAIMISAPPSCDWEYGWQPEPGSPEEHAIHVLSRPPRSWC